jgi:hypothetical protein
MSDAPFRGAAIKLDRAKHHINDLNARTEVFFDSHSIFVLDNIKAKQRSVFLKTDKSIPDEFSAIIGDAVHNLRSALDLLTNEIVRPHNPPRPKEVMFPFSPNAKSFKAILTQRQIHLAGEDIVAKFCDLKPYPRGNDLLYGLHALDILDKHTLIISTGAVLGLNALNLQTVDPNAPTDIPPILFFRAENQCLMSWPYDPTIPAKKDAYLDASFTIIFGPNQPFQGQIVIRVLRNLALRIQDAIDSFTP